MPEKLSEDLDIDETYDDMPELIPRSSLRQVPSDQPTLKPTYENPGIDTSQLTFPKDNEIITRSKGKLILDNVPLPLEESIKTYVRVKKKPYKSIKYKQ